ncbi:hypothetical protein [Myroides sp. LJL119]
MKKIIGLLACLFLLLACENDVETSDPGMQALTNNEDSQQAFVFQKWRPEFIYATLANESVLQLKGETDTTRFTIRIPYVIHPTEDTVIILGERIHEGSASENDAISKDIKASQVDAAYAIYTLRDKFDRQIVGQYQTNQTDESNSYGKVILYGLNKQMPGTISGEFYINLDLDTKNSIPSNPKHKERFEKLAKKKEFTQGYFYRIPLEAAN